MSRQSPSQSGTSADIQVGSSSTIRHLAANVSAATIVGAGSNSATPSVPRPLSSAGSTNGASSMPQSSNSAFRVVGSLPRPMTPTNLLAGNNALVPLVEALPLEFRVGSSSNRVRLSDKILTRVSTEMVNACGRGSNSNLQSLGNANAPGNAAAPNVTTSTASVTGMMTMGNGNTSAFTSQHSTGGEFFYFDDDLRDFSSAGDSAAPPVPAAAELIAADVDVESIERLLERLRRSDVAHGQRQKQQGSTQGTSDTAQASVLQAFMRQTDLARQQQAPSTAHQHQALAANYSNKTAALTLFGVCGQSKSDSCLAGSRSSPDTYGLLSGSTGAGEICVSGRELSMSWPLNDSAIVFRQYPLFADDTALMLTSSMLAACPGDDAAVAVKSATVASGLTTAALLQAHRRQQQQQQILMQQQLQGHPGAITSSTTGSMTLNSELMDVLSRKHNYRLTFANHAQQSGAVGRSGLQDSLASDRSHFSRGSATDFADSTHLYAGSSAAAKAALLRKLQDDLNARCVNITYEKIKNQLFGQQANPSAVEGTPTCRELVPIENVNVFQPIEKAPVVAKGDGRPKPTSSTTAPNKYAVANYSVGRRSRNTSENCATPATDNNSAEDGAEQHISNSLHIDSSDLDDDYGESKDKRLSPPGKEPEVAPEDVAVLLVQTKDKEKAKPEKLRRRQQVRSRTVGAVVETGDRPRTMHRRTSSETRSSSMPLSSQVNDGCIEAWRARSTSHVSLIKQQIRTEELQFAWPVPKMVESPKRSPSRRNQTATPTEADAKKKSPMEAEAKKKSPTPVKKSPVAMTSGDDDDEMGGVTRYHSPSPVKAVTAEKPRPAKMPSHHRLRSESPSSSSSVCSSTSSSSLSCCEDDRVCHRGRPSKTTCSSCQTVVPSSAGPPHPSLATITANIAVAAESPQPAMSAVSPGACSSSSYATVASHQQRSRHPTQIMAANFIPPSTATSSAQQPSPLTCQHQNSCLCLAFAQIWHSVLAAHNGASSVPSSSICQHQLGHTLSKLAHPASAAGSPRQTCPHHHRRRSHHRCRHHHRHHRYSDSGTEDLRTIGTQFPIPCNDCATQTPPMNSPQMTVRSAITAMTRNSSAEKSPEVSRGPMAVIFDPQNPNPLSSDGTSQPDSATTAGSPPAVRSYFFTFRSMPDVNFLRSPVEARRKNWKAGNKADDADDEIQQMSLVEVGSHEEIGEPSIDKKKQVVNKETVPQQGKARPATGSRMPGAQPPPPPRPPRNRPKRVGSNTSPGSHQHSSGDSGASLASYSVDTTSLSRSPRFPEEESGIGGMHLANPQQSPPGMLMEQCGRRLLLLPQAGKAPKDSPTSEQSPKPTAVVARQLQPCIAEEQTTNPSPSPATTALLSATVDLQSPSSALLHNRVTSSPDVKAPRELFPRSNPVNNAFMFNDETVACLHATSPFINPVLRREEEQAKERVRSLGNAVDEILHLFEPTTTSAPTATNAFNAKRASLHYVVYSALCPSLVHLLNHGFITDKNISLFAAVVEIITTGEVSEQSVTLVCQVAEMRVADTDDKKLLALFVGLLNLRWLPQWLCELYQNQEGVRRFYAENALLAAATSGCRALFWAAVQSLRPLSTLDLQLSLTSILNHHDVSSGAFPAISAAKGAKQASSSLKPPQQTKQPVEKPAQTQPKKAAQKVSPKRGTPPPAAKEAKTPVAPIASSEDIIMDEVVSPKPPKPTAAPRNEGPAHPRRQPSGIPSAPSSHKQSGSIPKPRKITRQTPSSESPETVEKAQPVVTVMPPINEPKASSHLMRNKNSLESRRSNATPPATPTPAGLAGHPPTPATTPLSGKVRLPSSTPIFQRGNSADSKRPIAGSADRRAMTSPASASMANSSGSSRKNHHSSNGGGAETPASLNNINVSSSSGSASPSTSRRRPLAFGGSSRK